MKKQFTLLLLLIASLVYGQDLKPADISNFKYLQSPFFFYNLPDSSVWIYKNQLYGWTKLDRAGDPWYIKMFLDQDTVILPIHKKDTLRLPVYKLKADSVTLSGYITRFSLSHHLDSIMALVYTRLYLDSALNAKQGTITKGTVNQYFRGDLSLASFPTLEQYSDSLARAAISLTTAGSSGASTYDPLTGNINIPQYAGQSMVYPPTGIPVSTGSSWGASISNNSVNWDMAYSWGNHAIEGYLKTESDPTIYSWAKAATKPSYSFSEVGAAPSSTVSFPGFGITHSLSAYGDHSHSEYVTGAPWTSMGYLTSSSLSGYATQSWVTAKGYLTVESDPTVYAWAKASTKPTYNYSEVGAAPSGTVSFPGFGTTHTLAAYGDHTHSGVYLPLSGGTLTGALSGTSASFSSSISASDFCNSDIRLKNLVGPLGSPDFMKASSVHFHKYTFKADSAKTIRYGVVAQEVEKIFPELIHTDDQGMKSVNYIDLLVLLVAEQKEELQRLEKRIEILENNEK